MTADSIKSLGSRIPIWLDCDPGHDDAVAILLSCFLPQFELLGISASYGNASPEKTAYNALSLLTAMGKCNQIPVYAGAQRPWVRKAIYAPDIHGQSGLDGTNLLPVPRAQLRSDKSYLEAMTEAIETHSGDISLISTGSLTSVATLLREKPHLKSKIRYISIMGGGIHVGNRNENESAEFNIWIDPQAANSILQDPEVNNKCILIPLDLTHKAIATKDVESRVLSDGSTNFRRLFYDLFVFFGHSYENAQGFESGAPVHDPLTLMPLLELYKLQSSEAIKFEYKRLELNAVESENSPDLGQTKVFKEHSKNSNKGTIVGFDLNIQYFWDQVYLALNLASQESTI
ncbi:LANO_0D02740g1_1 [Lachancea nothofagi CBS 11611]|uniref:LANO_0D02740g1_1 n=1 Tax=Lachancea nothofagi CBS 11611 TaxID=1266666 RepID=A0A1G4JEJ5_9SACH|nr:LANO_0D02740g1_1 [Lachancea nothofagi CBS 11611]